MDDTQKTQNEEQEVGEPVRQAQGENANEEKAENDSELQNDDIAHLQEALSEADAKYKRALADYQNLQRFTDDQKSTWAKQSARNIILKLLPILDTLMLVQKHLTDEGLELAIKQFLDTLAFESVTRIKTEGEKFDPALMECITIQEGKDGMVLEEVRAGYMLSGSVLRPAQVIVGQSQQN